MNNDLFHMFTVIDDRSLLPSGALRRGILSEWFTSKWSNINNELRWYISFSHVISKDYLCTCYIQLVKWDMLQNELLYVLLVHFDPLVLFCFSFPKKTFKINEKLN